MQKSPTEYTSASHTGFECQDNKNVDIFQSFSTFGYTKSTPYDIIC
jgi:hypothetical protein